MPQDALEVTYKDVHVWLISPDVVSKNILTYVDILDSNVLKKSIGFHCAKDRLLFFCEHISLRMILGLYLQIPPSKIEYIYGKNENSSLYNMNIFHDLKLKQRSLRSLPITLEKSNCFPNSANE